MKWQISLLCLCALASIAEAQFPGQSGLTLRSAPGRPRPRWPPGAPVSFNTQYMIPKGPPQIYRGPKPVIKLPNMYGGGMWKMPLNFRQPGIKEPFRTLQPSSALMANTQHQLLAGPPKNLISGASFNFLPGQTSAHKLFAGYQQPYGFVGGPTQKYIASLQHKPMPASPPSHSYLLSQAPTFHLAQAPEHNLVAGSASVQNLLSSHVGSLSNQLVAGPSAQALTRPMAYPIRIDGDGGPIHTIPAPNLSLADKPIVVPEYSNHIESSKSKYQNKLRGGHTYEVTEDTNDKTYQDHQYNGQNSVFGFDQSSSQTTKLSPSRNTFSSVTKHHYSPQTAALRAQSPTPILTSQELFQLMSGSSPQQQLADTYSLPLLQQPQLQQHFHQQTLDANVPLQPFTAYIQPTHGGVNNMQQSVLFKPDPKYVQKIQEQFLKQTTFQPNYQSFNYVEPGSSRPESIGQSEALKADFEEAVKDERDSNKIHYNVVRNTMESAQQTLGYNLNRKNNQSNVIEDSDADDSFNVETRVKFLPTPAPEYEIQDFSDSDSQSTAYYPRANNVGSGSVSDSYFSSLSNREVADTLATLQAASNLINMAKSNDEQRSPETEYAINLNPYYSQNTIPESEHPAYVKQSNNVFTPIKGTPFSLKPEDGKSSGEHAPIRIFVPDQYDDIETEPSENIEVSASLNTNQTGINDMLKNYNNEDDSDIYNQEESDQDSERIAINTEMENNMTIDEFLRSVSADEEKKKSGDVLVMVQKNSTNPSLDIVTKDWKTSIIIKPKMDSGLNQISEFGNRLRLKRDD